MLMNLKLSRPLAVIDLETTSADVKTGRIVEYCMMRVFPSGASDRILARINPGVPIPPAATAIHRITDADVADCPRFRDVADSLYLFLEGCDLCGFNAISFDLPVLLTEFSRAGLRFGLAGRRVIDPMKLYHAREKRDLAAALKFYCGRDHDGAHGAEADVLATIAVLDGQVERYDDLPDEFDALHAAIVDPAAADISGCFRREGEELIFTFGKHAGKPLRQIAALKPDYLEWMLNQDFLDDTKDLVIAHLR
jgi:DNA polymerase-3 subunit epsilon